MVHLENYTVWGINIWSGIPIIILNLIPKETLVMKKYSVLLAILALLVASLACQTIMGGGGSGFNVPNATEAPQAGDAPTLPPVTTDGGNITVGGKSEFPVASDATNVVSAPGMVTFQTKMSSDAVVKFYRDEFTKAGYKEDASKAITFGKTFTLAFNGYKSGKVIYVAGADAGGGLLSVTITLG
jgi:hypothetical protein